MLYLTCVVCPISAELIMQRCTVLHIRGLNARVFPKSSSTILSSHPPRNGVHLKQTDVLPPNLGLVTTGRPSTLADRRTLHNDASHVIRSALLSDARRKESWHAGIPAKCGFAMLA